MSHILPTSRPQPVRLMAVVLSVLGFLTGAAGLGDLIPKVLMAWLIIIYGAIQIGWGTWVASQVTPLSNPQSATGTPLVPSTSPPPSNVGNVRPEGGYTYPSRLLSMVILALAVACLCAWLALTFHPF